MPHLTARRAGSRTEHDLAILASRTRDGWWHLPGCGEHQGGALAAVAQIVASPPDVIHCAGCHESAPAEVGLLLEERNAVKLRWYARTLRALAPRIASGDLEALGAVSGLAFDIMGTHEPLLARACRQGRPELVAAADALRWEASVDAAVAAASAEVVGAAQSVIDAFRIRDEELRFHVAALAALTELVGRSWQDPFRGADSTPGPLRQAVVAPVIDRHADSIALGLEMALATLIVSSSSWYSSHDTALEVAHSIVGELAGHWAGGWGPDRHVMFTVPARPLTFDLPSNEPAHWPMAAAETQAMALGYLFMLTSDRGSHRTLKGDDLLVMGAAPELVVAAAGQSSSLTVMADGGPARTMDQQAMELTLELAARGVPFHDATELGAAT